MKARLRSHATHDAWRLAVNIALPVAAALALVWFLAQGRGSDVDLHASILVKGDPTFALYAQRAGRVFAVGSGSQLGPGDQIRLAVRPRGLPYILVVSIDGASHASVYVPYQGRESVPIDDADEVTLPGSIVLDATPGPERIFALFSRAPIQAAAALDALREVGRLGADGIRNRTKLAISVEAQASFLFENAGVPIDR